MSSQQGRLNVVGPISLAGVTGVIILFAVTKQLWPAVIAGICWLAIVLWFVWPRRQDEIQEVRTKSRDTLDLR